MKTYQLDGNNNKQTKSYEYYEKKYLEFLAIYFVTRVYDIIVDKLK